MSRRKAATKREKQRDARYGSQQVAGLTNVVMIEGKKSIAAKIVYQALDVLVARVMKESKEDEASEVKGSEGKSKKTPVTGKAKSRAFTQDEILEALHKALNNAAPTVEVKSRRVGGATYQVPMEVRADRAMALAMRWVVTAAKGRSEKTMALRLAAELYDASQGRGAALKKRDEVHRMAEANKAFAHYRW